MIQRAQSNKDQYSYHTDKLQEDSLSNLSEVSHKMLNHGRRQSYNPYVNTYNGQQQVKLNYNFTVAVRVKPLLQNQLADSKQKTSKYLNYTANNQQTLILQYPKLHPQSYSTAKNKKYTFDNICIDKSNQEIYKKLIKPKIQILKQNYNITLLTYGITGSGKTHTIFGSKENLNKQDGIAMMFIQDVIKQFNNNNDVKFYFSYLQIYNEQVYDLLVDNNIIQNIQNSGFSNNITDENMQLNMKSLAVREDSHGRVNIPELSKINIKTKLEVSELIEKGNNMRACSSNYINKFSSRSHAIIQLFCYNTKSGIQNVVTIIDLAGSERHVPNLGKINGVRDKSVDKEYKNLQKQGSNINKSLLALGNCLKALQSGSAHVPYRDSKLTRILKQDLSGKSHNIMIACVGRNYSQSQQTVNTLNYASRAAKIKVQKVRNQCINDSFQCKHCLKLTSWKTIVQNIPKSYLPNYSVQKTPKPMSVDRNQHQFFKSQLNLSSEFQKFKTQILQFVGNQILSLKKSQKQNNLLNEQNQFLSSRYLFPNNNSSGYNIINKIENSDLNNGISNIFNLFQSKISQILKNYRQYSNSNNSSFTIQYNNSKIFENKTKIIRAVSLNKQNKNKIQSQKSEKPNRFTEIGISQNLQTFRSHYLNELDVNASNLRRKISLKNNKNTYNLGNTANSTQNNSSIEPKIKTQRMNPDTDLQFNPLSQISCKQIIIGKLRIARKKHIPDIHYTHQNCAKFEYDDEKIEAQNSQEIHINNKIKQINNMYGERQQVNVSSFMEDDQLGSCY